MRRKQIDDLAARLRREFDRRYVRVDSGASSEGPSDVFDSASSVASMDSLDQRVSDLESTLEAVLVSLEGLRSGAAFVGSEDPVELRKHLFTARRLAEESARAIEGLLQADMLLRRTLNSVVDDEFDAQI